MKRSLLALALLATVPFAAQADDKLSYTYVEGNYLNTQGDNSLDADGFGLRGSYEFGQSGFYAFGGYSQTEFDDTNIDADTTDFGLGYHHSLGANADLIGEVAHSRSDLDFAKLDGFRTSVGVRGSFSDSFEGLIKANYYDGSDFDGDFTGTVGAQYKITQTWGITGEAEFGDNGESYLVGVRASF
ncbi:diffusible signal factor-reguated Ax21 faimly protein [Arenimonas daejeonensis]|uniref:porin n=1 Tax=Arenimonas daejeonensis TaxID=370777 RepID=UPI0011BD6F2A|nr:diffusible signal factor-reguated Ax21 faimly protein [Arenimonas daejeonensis]